ncbi:MAG: hypothetical protein HKP57_02140 [Halobacteria archaeon]|nr:hypothetical protein [Halobacteria archaeon]
MKSEALYIAILVAPWALALIAYLYYRRRQRRKAPNGSGAGRSDDARGV